MAIYVFQTKECSKDALRHSIQKDIERLSNKILKEQRTTIFENFPYPYLKKRLTRQLRLIATERKIEDDIIIIFYRILVRGGQEYDAFLQSPKEYGQEKFIPLVDDEYLKSWLIEQKKSKPVPVREPLSQEEYSFLYGTLGRDDMFMGDFFIYETHDWSQSVRHDKVQHRLIYVAQKLMEIVDHEETDGVKKVDDTFYIHYELLKDKKILLLKEISSQTKCNTTYNDDLIEIKRHSVKSYPAIILASEDEWINIQKNNDANMVLSPEETELLTSISKNSNNLGFPIFINGRAGSGKSTILQFAFADYSIFYDKERFTSFAHPIFLTYSHLLVERSRQNVAALIKYNFKYIEEDNEELIQKATNSIQTFKDFLLAFLPQKEKEELFKEEYYIDYPVFRNLWMKHFQNHPRAMKDYGVDISWHVIRGYIKGFSLDEYLEIEDYQGLPQDERTVSDATYKLVYNQVWENWYKPLCKLSQHNKHYWDDQDLVRYIIDHNYIKSIYPAIFCDEAQDFTKIELELILRLNCFTHKKITSEDLKRVPFAFAGDPFQTLNPTGFRWEAIKATYVEKFIYSLAPELRYGSPKLNYKELTFNYRSSQEIVKVSNSIQLLRRYLFNYHSIAPQETWKKNKNVFPPTFHFIEDVYNQTKIKEQQSLAIIVPCNSGEEKEFVELDEFLKNIVEVDETGVPKNVYSPMRAKGLEFQRVLLYRFADYRPKLIDFTNQNFIPLPSNWNNEDKIQLEYFINQMYVAVSRAQNRLFILEQRNNIHQLWGIILDPHLQENFIQLMEIEPEWISNIGLMVRGTSESWDNEHEEIHSIAIKLEAEGKRNHDPYLLRQAALYYNRDLEKFNKEKECKAFANLYEDNYKKAGDLFFEIGHYDKALQAYWKGKAYKNIIEQFLHRPNGHHYSTRIEVKLSQLLTETLSLNKLITFIERFQDYFDNNNNIVDKIWTESIDLLVEKIIKCPKFNLEDYEQIYRLFAFAQKKTPISQKNLAELAYVSKNYKLACSYFEKANLTNTNTYELARIEVLLDALEKGTPLTKKEYGYIYFDYRGKGLLKEALDIAEKIKDYPKILETLRKATKILDQEQIQHYLTTYLTLLIQNREWPTFIKLLTNPQEVLYDSLFRFFDNELLQHIFEKEISSSSNEENILQKPGDGKYLHELKKNANSFSSEQIHSLLKNYVKLLASFQKWPTILELVHEPEKILGEKQLIRVWNKNQKNYNTIILLAITSASIEKEGRKIQEFFLNFLQNHLKDIVASLDKHQREQVLTTYIKWLISSRKWFNLIDLMLEPQRLLEKKSLLKSWNQHKNNYLLLLLQAMASSPFENDNKRIFKKISDFLHHKFIEQNPSSWAKYYTPELVGAAIEKSSRDIDALQFYEKIIKSQLFDEHTIKYAERRWIVVKLRQARREEKEFNKARQHGNLSNQNQTTSLKSLKHKKEASQAIINIGILNEEDFDEPEYPDIEKILLIQSKLSHPSASNELSSLTQTPSRSSQNLHQATQHNIMQDSSSEEKLDEILPTQKINEPLSDEASQIIPEQSSSKKQEILTIKTNNEEKPLPQIEEPPSISPKTKLPLQPQAHEQKSLASPKEEAQQRPPQIEFTIHDVKFLYLAKKKRINVDIITEGFQIGILLDKKTCQSFDVEFQQQGQFFDSEYIAVEFTNEETKITIKSLSISIVF